MDYTPPRRNSNYSQYEHRPRGSLDDRIEYDFRSQRIKGASRRREELDGYEDRPSFESRIGPADNRTLEERIGYVQPAYKKMPVDEGTGTDGNNRPVYGGKQNKKGVKVQPTKVKPNHYAEFRMLQDEANEKNAPDAVPTAPERAMRFNENAHVENGSNFASSNALGNTSNIEMQEKLRTKLLESLKKKPDGSQNTSMKENGSLAARPTDQAAPMDYMSALEQSLSGPIPTSEVKAERGAPAIEESLTPPHSTGDNFVPSECQQEQSEPITANEKDRQHTAQQKQGQEEDKRLQLQAKRTRNEEKQREAQLPNKTPEDITQKKEERKYEKQQNRETTIKNDHSSGHNEGTAKSDRADSKVADVDEELCDTIVLKPFAQGPPNMDKAAPKAGSKRKDTTRFVQSTPIIPSDAAVQSAVEIPNHSADIEEKDISKSDSQERQREGLVGNSAEKSRERMEGKIISMVEAPQAAVMQLPLVSKEINLAHSQAYQDGGLMKLAEIEAPGKEHTGGSDSSSGFDRRDNSQNPVRAGEKHLAYPEAQYREDYRPRLREEELSRQYASRPLHYLPARSIPEPFSYHPAEYPPYASRYFPIRGDDLQGRRLELEYDPYYKDLAEWLDLTGYHDMEFRQVSLRRHRELQRERFYPPVSGAYLPVSAGVPVPYEQKLFRSDRLSMPHPPPPIRLSPEAPSPIVSRPLPQPEPAPVRIQEEKQTYPRHPAEHLRLTPPPPMPVLKKRAHYEDQGDDTGRHVKTPRLNHDDHRPRPSASDTYSNKDRRIVPDPTEQKANYRRIDLPEDAAPPRPTAKRAPARLSPVPPPREPRSRSASSVRRFHEHDQRTKEQKRELFARTEAERARPKPDFESPPYQKKIFEKQERHPPSPDTPARQEKAYYKPKVPAMKKALFRDDSSLGMQPSEPDYDRPPPKAIRHKPAFEDNKPKANYGHGKNEHFEEPRYPYNRSFGPRNNRFQRPHGELGETNVSSALFAPIKSETKYFMIKSFDYQNVIQAQKDNIWATQEKNTEILEDAFYNARDVILLFSVNKSKKFQGYARMESAPGSVQAPEWVDRLFWKSSPAFKILWITKCEIEFYTLAGLKNQYNEGEPVFVGRDCQEIDAKCGAELCKIIDERAMFSREYHHPHHPQRRE